MEYESDPRHLANGSEIPTITYSDQPYIVKTDDGAWLCCITTGVGREGEPGQIVTTMRSADQGQTWTQPVLVEPAGGPEASWAVLLKTPAWMPRRRRIYIFYIHNSDNLRAVKADNPPYKDGLCTRVDSLGYFVFKFSDDDGRSWSEARYPIPVREMDIDRKNPYGGAVRFFWNVGRPFVHDGAAYVPMHKVGGFGEGFFTRSEGVLLKSANLLTESDPEKIAWETLPDGDFGLRTPSGGGSIAEEQSFSVLSDGSFFCVYRTIDGHAACCYSRDGGHTWTAPQYMRYADGRLMKHPRAANFAWRCANGNFLYWFHNHGGRFIREHPRRRSIAYEDRNPVWLCGGVEADSPDGKIILWSQPEIVLYDDDPWIRMSYPDLVEEGGKYFLTETQKDKARVHQIDAELLEGLWAQASDGAADGAPFHGVPSEKGLLLNLPAQGRPMPGQAPAPALPAFTQRDHRRPDYGTQDLRQGFALDLWLRFDALDGGQVVLDNRIASGQGFCLKTTARGTLELVLNDGRTESRWECDPALLRPGKLHHVVVNVDGGPKIITFIVDGTLNDGGEHRQFGWGRYNPNLRGVNGDETLRIAPSMQGAVTSLKVYARYLRTSEAIASYRAGLKRS
ncbi:MAG: hypothetical protein FJ280_14955 [Planctomycetes bacterium]|nr:hypothetical protein [Planctomycetota bacterium]